MYNTGKVQLETTTVERMRIMALTAEQEETLLKLLSECEPGKMSSKLFYAFCRLFPRIAIELVLLQFIVDNQPEIFLTKRPSQDPHFPKMWHIPGTVMRVTDFENIPKENALGTKEQFALEIERIAKGELGIELEPRALHLMPRPLKLHSNRGPCLHFPFVYVLTCRQHPKGGRFFQVANLPLNIVPSHRIIIAEMYRGLGEATGSDFVGTAGEIC